MWQRCSRRRCSTCLRRRRAYGEALRKQGKRGERQHSQTARACVPPPKPAPTKDGVFAGGADEACAAAVGAGAQGTALHGWLDAADAAVSKPGRQQQVRRSRGAAAVARPQRCTHLCQSGARVCPDRGAPGIAVVALGTAALNAIRDSSQGLRQFAQGEADVWRLVRRRARHLLRAALRASGPPCNLRGPMLAGRRPGREGLPPQLLGTPL